jgi:hypothetical protein
MASTQEQLDHEAIQRLIREARATQQRATAVPVALAVIALIAVVVIALQSRPVLGVPLAVSTLSPPKGEDLLLRAFAKGVQIYECRRDEAVPRWGLVGPDAVLTDDSGRTIGKHYEGPTWEAADGSIVEGRVVGSSEAADPTAIPHLLLKAKAHRGSGVFARVASIQRLNTVGGRAPMEGCGETDIGRRTRVQYTATYYFYEDPRPAS